MLLKNPNKRGQGKCSLARNSLVMFNLLEFVSMKLKDRYGCKMAHIGLLDYKKKIIIKLL